MAVSSIPVYLLQSADLFEAIQPVIHQAKESIGGNVDASAFVNANDRNAGQIIARADSVEHLRELESFLRERLGEEQGVKLEGESTVLLPAGEHHSRS